MLEDVIRLNSLYDYYGELLTENQRRCFELYYLYDNSLSEIADEISISKQGVSNNLKKAISELEDMESKLNLVSKIEFIRNQLLKINEELKNYEGREQVQKLTEQILEELDN